MAVAEKKSGKPRITYSRYEIRFRDASHYEAVREAAKKAGLSINSWLVTTALQTARAQLAELRKRK